MVRFSDDAITLLTPHLIGQHIRSLSLATHGFTLEIDDIVIDCKERVFAAIDGERFAWDDAPNAAPWGALVRQTIVGISIPDPSRLRLELASGDYIDIETVEGQHESVTVLLPSADNKSAMAIY